MAGKKDWRSYRVIGAVALDAYRESTARPLPQEKPAPRPARKQAPQEAPRGGLSLFGLIGGAVCAFLLVLVVFAGSLLRQQNARIDAMEQSVSLLKDQRAGLETEYKKTVDLSEIAVLARLMGMKSPQRDQVISLAVPAPEAAPVPEEKEEDGPLALVWQAVWDTAAAFVEYLGAP